MSSPEAEQETIFCVSKKLLEIDYALFGAPALEGHSKKQGTRTNGHPLTAGAPPCSSYTGSPTWHATYLPVS